MSIEQQAKGKKGGEIRYLTPLNIETNKAKKYCRFKKSGINETSFEWTGVDKNRQNRHILCFIRP